MSPHEREWPDAASGRSGDEDEAERRHRAERQRDQPHGRNSAPRGQERSGQRETYNLHGQQAERQPRPMPCAGRAGKQSRRGQDRP